MCLCCGICLRCVYVYILSFSVHSQPFARYRHLSGRAVLLVGLRPSEPRDAFEDDQFLILLLICFPFTKYRQTHQTYLPKQHVVLK